MISCPCCENLGLLPSTPVVNALTGVVGAAVDGAVIKTMCEQCVGAAFIPGYGPHPHPVSADLVGGSR